MNPVLLAEILASAGEAAVFITQAITLHQQAADGEFTEGEIKDRWQEMKSNYASARQAWEDAGNEQS